jgi:hypothetical protein
MELLLLADTPYTASKTNSVLFAGSLLKPASSTIPTPRSSSSEKAVARLTRRPGMSRIMSRGVKKPRLRRWSGWKMRTRRGSRD